MDGSHFDDLIRSLSGSRRLLVSGALALTAGWPGADVVEAKRKRKRKRKKKVKPVQPNEFGCFEVGDPCQNADQCCSGICDGKKGRKTCRAHDTGTCNQEDIIVPCDNRTDCGCFRTTAGSDVCVAVGASECAACQRDADCEALGFPPGSACAPAPCESGVACMVPCGTVIP